MPTGPQSVAVSHLLNELYRGEVYFSGENGFVVLVEKEAEVLSNFYRTSTSRRPFHDELHGRNRMNFV